jgi:hypothetical protein
MMLLGNRKTYSKKQLGTVLMVCICLTSAGCARVAFKTLSFGYETVKEHRAEKSGDKPEASTDTTAKAKKNPVESELYITKLGDTVSLRFPSSLFFINDTANSLPNYHQSMGQLVEVIQRYPHNVIQVNVNFQVHSDNRVALQVASNQARYFTSTLSQRIHSGFASSDGDTLLRSNILNHEYSDIGNFIEIELR